MQHIVGLKLIYTTPYGSDVYKYSQQSEEFTLANKVSALLGRSKVPYRSMNKGTHSKYMRKAIVEADHILAEYVNEEFEEKLSALPYKGKYEHIPMPMIYHNEYSGILEDKNADVHWKSIIDQLKEKNDFLLLYHGRQEWKSFWNAIYSKEYTSPHYRLCQFCEKK